LAYIILRQYILHKGVTMAKETKFCKKCNQEKHVDDFPIRQVSNSSGGKTRKRRHECRLCYNEYIKNYLKGNSKHKERVANGKQAKRNKVREIKEKSECQICGYNKTPNALHFHHIDPKDKKFNIGWACGEGRKWSDIEKEMKKCVILCANCHAEVEDGTTKLE